MYVSELASQLQAYPQGVWIDVMFDDDTSLYNITGLDLYTLSQGNERLVLTINEEVPLRSA